ncbi:hypothetical protein AM231_19230 [Paenibacillus solani]|uniref:Uncharacterized protein n=1 Tax=Paenibacillus solani TaxID=1705565 RepID=A0A0M1NJN7_9BACL|nr:hypothetical protein AM231_19230 [Paenibacillus solani]
MPGCIAEHAVNPSGTHGLVGAASLATREFAAPPYGLVALYPPQGSLAQECKKIMPMIKGMIFFYCLNLFLL